jgi:hypothetical protein
MQTNTPEALTAALKALEPFARYEIWPHIDDAAPVTRANECGARISAGAIRRARAAYSALQSQAPASDEVEEEENLRRMMRDPRYWRDRDPSFVAKITEGFQRLLRPAPPAPSVDGDAIQQAEERGYQRRQAEIRAALIEAGGALILRDGPGGTLQSTAAPSRESDPLVRAYDDGVDHAWPAAREEGRQEGFRAGLEAAALIAKKRAEPRGCDSLLAADPTTGIRECVLDVRGEGCLCYERVEAAEEIERDIRALLDQPAPSGEAPIIQTWSDITLDDVEAAVRAWWKSPNPEYKPDHHDMGRMADALFVVFSRRMLRAEAQRDEWRARAEKAEAERDALRLQNDALRSGASLRTQLADFDRINELEAQLAEARARTVAYPDGSTHTDPGEPVQRIAQGRQQEAQGNE